MVSRSNFNSVWDKLLSCFSKDFLYFQFSLNIKGWHWLGWVNSHSWIILYVFFFANFCINWTISWTNFENSTIVITKLIILWCKIFASLVFCIVEENNVDLLCCLSYFINLGLPIERCYRSYVRFRSIK